jgi:hypothetical protein
VLGCCSCIEKREKRKILNYILVNFDVQLKLIKTVGTLALIIARMIRKINVM